MYKRFHEMIVALLLYLTASVSAQAGGVQTYTWPVLGTPIPSSAAYAPSVTPVIINPLAPDSQTVCAGYTASNVQTTSSGLTADLTLAGPGCNTFGTDIKALRLQVQYQNQTRLNVKIYPAYVSPSNKTQYLLDDSLVPSGKQQDGSTSQNSDLVFTWSNIPSFQFKVSRRIGGDVLFNTYGQMIVFQNQFLELVTSMVPNYNAYGLPESIRDFRIGNNYTQTFWNQYNVMNDQPRGANMHCVHPIYVETRYNGSNPSSSHAVFGRNMHGQEWIFKPTTLTYRAIGGSFDFYFLSGPTVKKALSQYQVGIVNTPYIQPYWGLGFHQVRWGFYNISYLQGVVDSYRRFNIPLESIMSDLDYMKEYRDFTNNEVTYPLAQFQAFIAGLHKNNQYYFPILDPFIYAPNPNNASDANPPYDRLIASEAYLRRGNGHSDPYLGISWPGYVAFTDFLVEKAQAYWTNELKLWHAQVPWDAFWLDVNDLSSFCTGSCGTGKLQTQPAHVPYGLPGELGTVTFNYPEGFANTNSSEAALASAALASQMAATPTPPVTTGTPTVAYAPPTDTSRNITFPPYALNNTLSGHSLEYYSVSPDATHNDQYNTTSYDLHNLYGHLSGVASYNALLEVIPGKRPFFLSRSTSPGDGNITGHWGGDANSAWGNMYATIAEALGFSIAGMPYFGVETCGFNGNADYELCSRWMQLSAFFPLYRNHNSRPGNTIDQYAYTWSSTIVATKNAINVRYALLAYMYTLFWHANQDGSTVLTALQWEFPNDESLAAVDNQFMVGPSILITPVLIPQQTTVKGVFPGSDPWYDWYTLAAVNNPTSGQNVTLDAPLSKINVHIRGGSIIPSQTAAYTTIETRQGPWSIIVAPDSNGKATGSLYLDDGVSPYTANVPTKNVDFTYANGTLTTKPRGNFVDNNALSNVTIAGYSGTCNNVRLSIGSVPVSCTGVKATKTGTTLYITGLSSVVKSAYAASVTLSCSA